MSGTGSNLPEWRADYLEQSDYSKVMSGEVDTIDLPRVVSMYGYDALLKYIGDSPIPVLGGIANVPLLYRVSSTGYEYDNNGKMVGYSINPTGDIYIPTAPNVTQVEFTYGKGSEWVNTVYYRDTDSISVPTFDYRVFVADDIPDATEFYAWRYAKDTDYSIVNGKLVFNHGYVYIVRTNEYFLANSFEIKNDRGLLRFDIKEQRLSAGNLSVHNLSVPMGELTVYMNGYTLLEGIDYYFNFPTVTIINKDMLSGTYKERIHVRYSGFPTLELGSNRLTDSGFIKNNRLSANGIYDIRDSKVAKLTVNGLLRDIKQYTFAETSIGNDDDSINGNSYGVTYANIPIDLPGIDIDAVKAKDVDMGKRVSMFLTERYPELPNPAISSMRQRYVLFSPLLSSVISDLASGILKPDYYEGNYTDMAVIDTMQTSGYESLYIRDPINPRNIKDDGYVEIHPSLSDGVVFLDYYGYRFITRVKAIYDKDNLTDLSPFVKLLPTQ
jgi:hypothetical protein